MVDARPDPERLPWLDTPRKPKPGVRTRRKLARAPLYALLSLFLLASVGVMSFLVGRGSVPIEPNETPLPPPAPPIGPVAKVTLPAPLPAEPAQKVAAQEAKPSSAPRAASSRKFAAQRATSRRSRARPARRTVRMARAAPPRPAPVRQINWPPPVSAGRSGQVVQLGAFTSARRADAAWARVTRAYPYLRTLPKVVTPMRSAPGYVRLYRLQLGARSGLEAHTLCRNLRRIGRGCIVV